MKLSIILLTVFCYVVQAQLVPSDQTLQCFIANAASVDTTCFNRFGSIGTALASQTLTDADLGAFCNECGGALNPLFVTCNSDLLQAYCSNDNGQFCFTRSTEIGTEVGTVISTSCLGVNCADSTCNQAVQNITCCYGSVVAPIADILPDGCLVQGCPARDFSGAATTLIAMPMFTAILIAIVSMAWM